MTKAILISTNGPYLDAIIDIAGESLCVFNEFSLADHSMPRLGEEFDIEFSNELSDDEDWEAMFSSNPDHRVGLEKIEG